MCRLPMPKKKGSTQMKTTVLTFNTQGNGSCLYSELIDLQSIGQLEVTRATTIEFNHGTQQWEVKDAYSQILFTHSSRSLCLAWEQQHFNH
jgi:hypothetical protein